MKKIVFALLFAVCSLSCWGQYPEKIDKYVNDYAQVIPDNIEASLEAKLQTLEKDTSHQYVVATFPELKGNLEETTVELARKWQVGQKDKNNGLVFFVFLKDANGKGKTRFETGYGLEGILPDSLSKSIYEKKVRPFLAKKDFAGGVTAAVDEISAIIRQEKIPENAESEQTGIRFMNILILVVFVVVGLVIVVIHTRRSEEKDTKLPDVFPDNLSRLSREIPPTPPVQNINPMISNTPSIPLNYKKPSTPTFKKPSTPTKKSSTPAKRSSRDSGSSSSSPFDSFSSFGGGWSSGGGSSSSDFGGGGGDFGGGGSSGDF